MEGRETSLNLGCGFQHKKGFINVDAYEVCKPDMVWNLNDQPWPWEDNSIDHILMAHVLEHTENWWGCIKEVSRVLKVGGLADIRVPDESSSSGGTYRDHNHVFTWYSFYGIKMTARSVVKLRRGTNAWAESQERIPLIMTELFYVPFPQYLWMIKWCPWLLKFCSEHLRNFIHEQRFVFLKIGEENNGSDNVL